MVFLVNIVNIFNHCTAALQNEVCRSFRQVNSFLCLY